MNASCSCRLNIVNDGLQCVFVYGTLKRGCANHDWIAGMPFLGEAETCERYALYMGENPYPFMIENEPCYPVRGELYAVTQDELLRLDDLEECPQRYCRKMIAVRADSGEVSGAWAYFYPQPEGELLPDGFYMEA